MRQLCALGLLSTVACLPRVGDLVDAGPSLAADGAACSAPEACESGFCSASVCQPSARPCAPAFAKCTTFVDATEPGATRVITFPQPAENRFAPQCLRIRLGQTATLESTTHTFSDHPLNQACGPKAEQLVATSGASKDFTSNDAVGVFGYYCVLHGTSQGESMSGAIEVVP